MFREYMVRDGQRDRHTKITVQPDEITVQLAYEALGGGAAQDGGEFAQDLTGKRLHIHPPYSVKLSDLRNRNEWQERSGWTLVPGDDGQILTAINLTADGLTSRRAQSYFFKMHGFNTILNLTVPFKDSDFREIGLRTTLPTANSLLITNENFVRVEPAVLGGTFPPKGFPWNDIYPALTLKGPDTIKADSAAELTVIPTWLGHPTERELSVDIHSLAGYLPKNRLTLRGPQTFKVHSLGLEPGDTIKVKAGFRFFTAVDEKVLTVVA